MIFSVSGVVKKAVIIPTLLTVDRVKDSIPDKAVFSIEHHLGIPDWIKATAQGFRNSKPPHGLQGRQVQERESAEPVTGHFIRRELQAQIQYTEVYAGSVTSGIQNRHDGKDHHTRDGNGPQKVVNELACTEVPNKAMGKIGEENRSQD